MSLSRTDLLASLTLVLCIAVIVTLASTAGPRQTPAGPAFVLESLDAQIAAVDLGALRARIAQEAEHAAALSDLDRLLARRRALLRRLVQLEEAGRLSAGEVQAVEDEASRLAQDAANLKERLFPEPPVD